MSPQLLTFSEAGWNGAMLPELLTFSEAGWKGAMLPLAWAAPAIAARANTTAVMEIFDLIILILPETPPRTATNFP
jgi:hypothetical protein